jgi:hypothetical protein
MMAQFFGKPSPAAVFQSLLGPRDDNALLALYRIDTDEEEALWRVEQRAITVPLRFLMFRILMWIPGHKGD